MKKFYLILLVCATAVSAKAQFFTQGDLSVNLQPNGSHDVNTCASQGQMMYMITIQNSFTGDSVKLKDMGGNLIYQEANATGQNPWNLLIPNYSAFGFAPDNQVVGGNVMFFGPPTKLISGPDTIYNIPNSYAIPVSNPCTYGDVTGKIYIDYNSDCVYNGADVPLSSVYVGSSVSLNSPSMSSTSASGYSGGSGDYTMQVQETWMTAYTASIPSYYQFIFPSTACSPGSYSFTTLPQSNVDFSLQCSSNLDVQCAIQSNGSARPNQPFFISPYVSNTGCTAASGVMKVVLDTNVIYNAGLSSNPATTISGDTLMWNYSNLSNLSNGMYWNSFFSGVYLTPKPTVSSGDILYFKVYADAPAGDVDPANNYYLCAIPVVNSYDPNLKEVTPKGAGIQGDIPLLTTDLTYTIHFQNTGTAVAYDIYVIDTLDADLEPSSLQILGATHSMQPQWLSSNVVKFLFSYILLPDSTSNEPASHGALSFKINLKNALPLGTQFSNKASIYFDANPAIVTNTTVNTLANVTGIAENKNTNSAVKVYPNPFSDNATFVFQTKNSNETYSFEMTDVLGKKVKEVTGITEKQFSVSRNGLENGVYFYKIYSAKTLVGIGKLVVE